MRYRYAMGGKRDELLGSGRTGFHELQTIFLGYSCSVLWFRKRLKTIALRVRIDIDELIRSSC